MPEYITETVSWLLVVIALAQCIALGLAVSALLVMWSFTFFGTSFIRIKRISHEIHKWNQMLKLIREQQIEIAELKSKLNSKGLTNEI